MIDLNISQWRITNDLIANEEELKIIPQLFSNLVKILWNLLRSKYDILII